MSAQPDNSGQSPESREIVASWSCVTCYARGEHAYDWRVPYGQVIQETLEEHRKTSPHCPGDLTRLRIYDRRDGRGLITGAVSS